MPAACPTCIERRQQYCVNPAAHPTRKSARQSIRVKQACSCASHGFKAVPGKGARAQMTVRPVTRGSEPSLHLTMTPSLSTLDTCSKPHGYEGFAH